MRESPALPMLSQWKQPIVSNATRMAALPTKEVPMKTYSSLQAEIAKLEKEAQALRKAELTKVIAGIKKAVATYGLTATDLGLNGGGAKRKAKANGKKATSIGVAKYHDPKTGKTWTGRGKPPAWIAGVKNRDSYLIEKQAA